MNNIGFGKRLAMRVVLLQVGCAILAAMAFWLLKGASAGLAALAGGMIAAVGTALLGWRMFAPGIAPAAKLQRAMFAGESLKWLWYVIAVWACFARFKLLPLPLLVGLIVSQFGYWSSLIGMKRGN